MATVGRVGDRQTLNLDLNGPVAERWRGGVAVQLFAGPRSCGRCGSGLVVEVPAWVQQPLLRHGGYGAAERFSPLVCLACGRASMRMVETVRPM